MDLPAFITRLTNDLRGVEADKHLMIFDTTGWPAPSIVSILPSEAGIACAERLTGRASYSGMFGFANP